ncbi:unnamed protein product [Sphagnum jensenii]|uniref:Myb-like domain-containing protein n=1 Tax=Sphagnum jensenii TaxID=128206 RepID=A0ABP1BJG9_9BRYO
MVTRAASVKQLRSSVAKSPPKRAPLKEINLQEERTPARKVREKKKEETTEVAVAAEIVQPGGPGARTSSSEFEGWTMEQYADLQKAYAMVRPGPNFWQEVARQVSGKTAKECFDKIYAAYPTPPAPQPRARRTRIRNSPLILSSLSPKPGAGAKKTTTGRSVGRKRNIRLQARRNVRELLRQQQTADRGYEGDSFAELENLNNGSSNQSSVDDAKGAALLLHHHHKSLRSTFSFALPHHNTVHEISTPGGGGDTATASSISSPEVLKKLKDQWQHDKYLDIIHVRQKFCKRKKKGEPTTVMPPQSHMYLNSFQTAKVAVMEGAKDILRSVKLLDEDGVQPNACNSFSDQEDDQGYHTEFSGEE